MKKYILLIFAPFLIASCTTLDSEPLAFKASEINYTENAFFVDENTIYIDDINGGEYEYYNNSDDILEISFDSLTVSDAKITFMGTGPINLYINGDVIFIKTEFIRNNKNYRVIVKPNSSLILNDNDPLITTENEQEYSEEDLPVELISFDSKLVNNQVVLDWSTATEINSDNFEIQRSIDTRNWAVIGNVKAAGNSSTKLDYQFIDTNLPVASVVYYRLVETDLDGLSQTFGPNAIYLEQTQNTVSIYPNPVNYGENIHVVSTYNNMDIRIFDASGRTYAEFETEYNHIELPMIYGQGVLFIEVKSGAATTTEKVIVR
ncbi:T9SS type A sorting domain-containing protein [Flammeovirga pectinis]|uniref:T9SS type A sorting domain-containing protein n=1 Tax=Flammeovirga pectinis TaxID=2494373 RepID=A0A3S9PBG6_9BACT|nr:T9SS type A sorting domain-containing protein [Flammeovirga pectinis]AZQ65517.1 T9SS type A sorting domain-containing protein [Flammeovirga pectinis]